MSGFSSKVSKNVLSLLLLFAVAYFVNHHFNGTSVLRNRESIAKDKTPRMVPDKYVQTRIVELEQELAPESVLLKTFDQLQLMPEKNSAPENRDYVLKQSPLVAKLLSKTEEQAFSQAVIDVVSPVKDTNKATGDNYRKILRGLSALERQERISEDDKKVLYAYMLEKTPHNYGDLAVNSVKNDILEALIDTSPMPDDLGHLMQSVIEDDAYDPIWREYVLQHVIFYYKKRWGDSSRNEDGVLKLDSSSLVESEKWQSILVKATEESENGMAGTALLNLKLLAGEYSEFDKQIVRKAAIAVLNTEKASVSSKVTAVANMGLSADGEDAQADFKMLQMILNNVESEVTLKMAGLASVASYVNSKDTDLVRAASDVLVQFSRGADKRLVDVANIHLMKLNLVSEK